MTSRPGFITSWIEAPMRKIRSDGGGETREMRNYDSNDESAPRSSPLLNRGPSTVSSPGDHAQGVPEARLRQATPLRC